MPKDYYRVLGVAKTATQDDIKKAFHKLAHKYHPDKDGGDAEKFKELSEAYSILSDDKKRAEYDSYGRVFGGGGSAGSGFGGFNGAGFDFSNFAEAFGGASGAGFDFGDIFGDIFGGRVRRGRDISIDLELSFKESVFGTKRAVLITKMGQCDVCRGSGGKPGAERITCTVCGGSGKIHETASSILGSITTVQPCRTCHGAGKVAKEKCAHCRGEGVLRKQEEIAITVPPGIEGGEMIRLGGSGEAMTGGPSGDLYVKVHITPDPRFSKDGANLITELSVKLSDALLGRQYTVQTLDGTTELSVPAGVEHGEMIRIKGLGVPFGKSGKRGDLYVRIKIQLPGKLSRNAKDLIEKLREEGI
ncbi:MAG: molecular chaperone DnaJ [Minisyncoccia bacterium]